MIDKEKISGHQRFGLRFLQVLLVLVAIFLVRDCMRIMHSSKTISEESLHHYYALGYEAGKKQAETGSRIEEPLLTDELLKKWYRDGFKKGWDATGDPRP